MPAPWHFGLLGGIAKRTERAPAAQLADRGRLFVGGIAASGETLHCGCIGSGSSHAAARYAAPENMGCIQTRTDRRPGLAETRPPVQALPLHQAVAVGAGNALEFYDFLTFSFFAVQIGNTFFPGDATGHGLLYTLATFGIGFITRPLGGWLIGRYGDRAGRRPAMVLSFAMMGLAMLGLALTPGYAQIGIAAPLLLLIFRLLQGFALGGEVGPATAFLVEAAPPHRRGLYVSIQYVTQDVAILMAGAVGFALSQLLPPADLDNWGWRVAFLLGVGVVPVGLWLRRRLPETMHAVAERSTTRARAPWRFLFVALVLLAMSAICDYVLVYITTYAQDSLKLGTGAAFGATIVLGSAEACADLTTGILADRYGRRPVMLTGLMLLTLLTIPIFAAMNAAPTAWVTFIGTAVLGILYPVASGPMLISIAESLPMAVRSASLAALYAIAMTFFGGSTQFVIKLLVDTTGSPLAPAVYMTAALLTGLAASRWLPESAPAKTSVAAVCDGGESAVDARIIERA